MGPLATTENIIHNSMRYKEPILTGAVIIVTYDAGHPYQD